MDYNRADDLNAEWAPYSHGTQSDGQVNQPRMNPFDSLPPASQAQVSTEARYGLDSSSFDTMAWQHHQVPYHGQTPSLHLSNEDEDADFDLFDRTYSNSTLPSPAFDQTSFVSLSPQVTPNELPSSSKHGTSYFNPRSSTDPVSSTAARKKERAQHNVVEHRYREKLNSQISQLKEKVPSLRGESSSPPSGQGSRRGGREPAKVGKSIILVKAGEYIDKLETDNQRLRKRNESLERLVQRLVQGRAAGSEMGDLNLA